MKERPILFNDEMVRAILDGRKTQTRRVVKLQPSNGWSFETAEGAAMRLGYITSSHPKKGKFGAFIRREIHPGSGKYEHDIIPCPYGQPGDQLWVRETTLRVEEHGFVGPVYTESEYGREVLGWGLRPGPDDPSEVEPHEIRRRPSIHMPRSMARLLLEVTAVRVERLQDITEADAKKEGCDNSETEGARYCGWYEKPRRAFRRVWERINGNGSWADNPWVWVVEFQRVDSEVPS
ncbi:hypothetical protein FZZ93_01240 [Halomonas eurihalina]|uniref:ASCH domain-containing protein n=1 Tax=Halomonas eurihalina TaxID=42566 RepID=A0A5D9DBN7_HALER|nr:hypothetical protein [Halomonas eurihalina]MDR5858180.1 hypothetical protein [Halomonas eurihalina]TZG41318.1 hypothetical protein FZZ93_01240 [Halomonas eurihalina]